MGTQEKNGENLHKLVLKYHAAYWLNELYE